MENQENTPNKAGRKKLIPDPDTLINWFEEYIKELKATPFKIKDWVGKDGDEVTREKERPITMVGFESYCFRKGYINDLKDYFSNDDGRYDDFQDVCRAIRNLIAKDQIEGGMAGVYNHNLTARLNGLVEKTQNENKNINRVINVQVIDTGSAPASNEKDIDID